MRRTTLVTGATGFAGTHLTELLRRRGDVVVEFNRRDGDDVRDYESVREAVHCCQPDLIFHLAAPAFVPESTTDPRRGLDVIVGGTLNVLEAVRHTGSRARVLLAGTSEEYGYDHAAIDEDTTPRPTTAYGVAKLAAGRLGLVYAATYGFNVVVTRAFNHTGPGHPATYAVSAFARKIVECERGRGDVVRHGNLDAVRNYTDVRDVVAAYALAVDLPTGIYNVASHQTVALRDVLDSLLEAADVPVRLEPDPTLYRPAWQRGDATDFPEVTYRRVTDAGWRVTIPLSATLDDVLNYWRERL